MSSSKKLLIRLSSAGDVLLTSPLLRLIKETEPDSEIHFVVKSSYADIVRFNPNVSRIHLVQEHADVQQLENLRRSLISEHFETTLDLHNNFRSVYLRKNTAKEVRVIRKDILKRAVLIKTKASLYSDIRPVALKYAQTYDKTLSTVPPPEIFIPEEAEDRAAALWNSAGLESQQAVFLCPGAKHFTKRWPVEYWSLLARKLSREHRIVLVGGTGDTGACAQIAKYSGALDYSGKLSLVESVAMMRNASIVVTNDSFLMHAANAVGKKIVAIFGSSVREFGFFPYGVRNTILEMEGMKCRPCSHVGRESCPKGHFNCMLEIKPDTVLGAAKSLLEN